MTIIAEIGQHHNGSMVEAERLILLAKEGGADLVKSQLFDSKKLYGEPKVSELTFGQAKIMFQMAAVIGIEMFFSVFDVERVKWCEEIGVKRYKIAFSQRNNTELYESVVTTNKDLIVSTGDWRAFGNLYAREASLLYCVPHYPAKLNQLIFSADFEDDYEGFSDHFIGLDAAKIALSRGAQIIEKHFCLNHHTGVDAPWSMDLEELKELKRFEQVCKEAL